MNFRSYISNKVSHPFVSLEQSNHYEESTNNLVVSRLSEKINKLLNLNIETYIMSENQTHEDINKLIKNIS